MQAANGHEECVDALIHHGADVTMRDNRGRTPLHMAAMCGHIGLFGSMIMVSTVALLAAFVASLQQLGSFDRTKLGHIQSFF